LLLGLVAIGELRGDTFEVRWGWRIVELRGKDPDNYPEWPRPNQSRSLGMQSTLTCLIISLGC
jgi:hypothetical protein